MFLNLFFSKHFFHQACQKLLWLKTMQSSIKANLKQNIVLVLKPATPSSFSRYPSTVKAVYTPLDSYQIIELRRKGKGGGGR